MGRWWVFQFVGLTATWVELLDPVALVGRFPSLGRDDVALAAYSPDDGWIDPASALHSFRRKARSLGVTYLEDRVVRLEIKKKLVKAAHQSEAVRPKRTWAGHYAQNMLDGNMILGPWVGGPTNFYVACGFSGHGAMHAPAVGLAWPCRN